jgi:hypothetical protein
MFKWESEVAHEGKARGAGATLKQETFPEHDLNAARTDMNDFTNVDP